MTDQQVVYVFSYLSGCTVRPMRLGSRILAGAERESAAHSRTLCGFGVLCSSQCPVPLDTAAGGTFWVTESCGLGYVLHSSVCFPGDSAL